MKLSILLTFCAAVAAGLASTVSANTPVPVSTVSAKGWFELIRLSKPYWQFSRALSHGTCWPQAALKQDGSQADPATLKDWPITGQGGCVDAGTAFPAYVSYTDCSSTEFRVAYNLYWPKDGWVLTGHKHDWEQVVVVWTSDGSNWTRKGLYMSRHGKFYWRDWSEMPSVSTDLSQSADGGLDLPVVFPAWSKHSMFAEKYTTFTDLISQSTNNAYRDHNYQYLNTDAELTTANPGTTVGDQINSYDWGDASSHPVYIYNEICSIS